MNPITNLSADNSETNFRRLVEGAVDLIWSCDLEHKFNYLSPRFKQIFGFETEEWIGKSFADLVHPDDLKQFITDVEKILVSNKDNSWIEFRNLRQDRSYGWVETSITAVKDIEATIIGLQGILRDRSDRKQTEKSLHQKEARTRKLLEAIPDIINLISSDGIYLESVRSNQLKDLIPIDVNPIGKHLAELLPPDIAAKQIQAVQTALTTQTTQVFEQKAWFGGKLQYEEVRVVPNSDDTALMIICDINDRKQAEDALRQSEARTRTILETIPDIINLYSSDGIFLEAVRSNQLKDLIPTSVDPIGKHLTKLLPPDVAASQLQAVQTALATQTTQTFEQQVWVGGSLQYEEVRVVPNQDRTALVIIRDISDRKQVEANLRRSEAHKSALISALPDLIMRVERDGTYLEFNAAKSFKGIDEPAVFIGKKVHEGLPFDLAQRRMDAIGVALETDSIQYYEQDIWVDGNIQTEEVRVVPYTEDEVLLLVRDISDRKQAELALLESQAKLKAAYTEQNILFNAMTDVVLVRNAQGRCLKVVPTKDSNLLGNPEEILSRTIQDELPPEAANIIVGAIGRALETKQIINCDYNLKIDDREVWFAASILPLTENTVMQVSRDISDRKQAEIALAESKQQLDLFFNNSLEGFFFMMLDRPIVWNDNIDKEATLDYIFSHQRISKVNQAMLDQYGAKEEEFLGMTPTDFFAHDMEQGKAVWRNLFDRGRWKVDTSERRVDGSQMWVEGDYICLYDREGRITGHFGVQRDISDRKAGEIALAQAKEAAEAGDRAKSEFLANMSHEIRTPMNGVLGMAQLLSLTELTDEQKDYAKTIQDSGEILLKVINDILDFSKIESGNLELEERPFILEVILKSVCNLLSRQATDREINLQYITHLDIPAVIAGDSSRLRQILLNLIGNAIKFTQQGNVTVSVSSKLCAGDSGKHELIFAIADTGTGINSDRLDILFQPFTQADASISRRYGGTGLGLAISKRLVELMGGTIWVESLGCIGGNPPLDWVSQINGSQDGYHDRGSVFYFSLSAQAVSASNLTTQITSVLHDGDAIAPGTESTIRILLAEDNRVNQKLALFLLKKLGYRADVANNGLEVLQMLKLQTYDLILMDMQMPEMDGVTATQMIRQNLNVQPRIIAMTANALPGDRQICLDAGMDDYISKPIQLAEIIRALSQYTSQN